VAIPAKVKVWTLTMPWKWVSKSSTYCSKTSRIPDFDVSHPGIQYSLYEKIDLENTECLNEEIEGSGKTVFKPYEQRLDLEKFVQSDADEELLFNIQFTGNVKLKGFRLIGANDESHPKKVRL
jgi:PITH domain